MIVNKLSWVVVTTPAKVSEVLGPILGKDLQRNKSQSQSQSLTLCWMEAQDAWTKKDFVLQICIHLKYTYKPGIVSNFNFLKRGLHEVRGDTL